MEKVELGVVTVRTVMSLGRDTPEVARMTPTKARGGVGRERGEVRSKERILVQVMKRGVEPASR